MLEDLAERVNSNSPLVHRGRWVNLTFTFGIGEDDFLITIEGGRVINIENRPLATRAGVFAIRASRETWASHWLKVPPRDYHDIILVGTAADAPRAALAWALPARRAAPWSPSPSSTTLRLAPNGAYDRLPQRAHL